MIASFIDQAEMESCPGNYNLILTMPEGKDNHRQAVEHRRNITRTQLTITGKQPNITPPELMKRQLTMPIWRMGTICMHTIMRQKRLNMF
jgi:hypothetical protein